MSKSRRSLPEINAGSMADIAFNTYIFLVTTTMDVDTGIAESFLHYLTKKMFLHKLISIKTTF